MGRIENGARVETSQPSWLCACVRERALLPPSISRSSQRLSIVTPLTNKLVYKFGIGVFIVHTHARARIMSTKYFSIKSNRSAYDDDNFRHGGEQYFRQKYRQYK